MDLNTDLKKIFMDLNMDLDNLENKSSSFQHLDSGVKKGERRSDRVFSPAEANHSCSSFWIGIQVSKWASDGHIKFFRSQKCCWSHDLDLDLDSRSLSCFLEKKSSVQNLQNLFRIQTNWSIFKIFSKGSKVKTFVILYPVWMYFIKKWIIENKKKSIY